MTEDLGMSDIDLKIWEWVIVKFILQVLRKDQKNSRVEIAEDILESINKNHKHKRIITGLSLHVST